jgi:hypothetical protein
VTAYVGGVLAALTYAGLYGGGCYAMSYAYTGNGPVHSWIIWLAAGSIGLCHGAKAAKACK